MPFKKPEVKGLDISLADINRSKVEDNTTSRTFFKVLEKTYLDQRDREIDFLSHHRWGCPPPVNETVLSHALTHDLHHSGISRRNRSKRNFNGSDSDAESGAEDTDTFLDAKSLERLACVANNIYIFDGPNYRTGYNFIKRIITDVRLVGQPSVNGFVMTASLYDKYHDMVVLKAPRRKEEFTDAAVNHELVVGKVLNSLRSIIPNFAFVLGSFQCGAPIVRPPVDARSRSAGKVLDWCRGGHKVKYLMYENISDSISFYDYCKKCTAQEYIDLIVQINYALLVAFEEHGFTHYDLHGDNILIRTVKESEDGFYIPYQGDFVYGNKLATFIDYGLGHVYLPGTDKISVGYKSEYGPRGNLDFISTGTYLDRPNPAADSYRILYTTLKYMQYYNREVYNNVKNLLYFFHPDDEELDLLFKESVSSYNVPYFGTPTYMERIKKFRYRNFLKYVREYCILNDLTDPVVSGNDYDEALDAVILFPGVSSTPTHLLRASAENSLLKKRIENIDELFDLIEPIVIYRQYLDINAKNFGESKIEGHSSLVTKVFSKIQNQTEYITELVNDEIKDLISRIKEIKQITYRKLPTNEVYIIRSPVALKDYLDSLEATVKYLDMMEAVEKRVEMIQYLKKNILVGSSIQEFEILEQDFNKIDDRKVIFEFIHNDIVSLADYLDSRGDLDKIDEKLDLVYESLVSVYPFENN